MKLLPPSRAYTLAEVLVAAGILVLVVAVMASVSLSLSAQEEQSARTAVVLNYHEQTARLWQLGLSPAEIEAIRPPAPAVTSLGFTEDNITLNGIGTLRRTTSNLVFRSSTDLITTNAALRTNTLVLVRPITP